MKEVPVVGNSDMKEVPDVASSVKKYVVRVLLSGESHPRVQPKGFLPRQLMERCRVAVDGERRSAIYIYIYRYRYVYIFVVNA